MIIEGEYGFSIVGAEMRTRFRLMEVPRDQQSMGVIGAIHSGRRDEVGWTASHEGNDGRSRCRTAEMHGCAAIRHRYEA